MDIDRLDIIISAEASKAGKQLENLITWIDKLSGALGGLNSSGLTGLANSVQKLSSAMQGMNGVKTTDFTKLANNIHKLAAIDTKGLNSAASAMSIIGKALSGLSGVSQNAQQIGEMAKSLSKLGNQGIQNAIENMPKLASALESLVNTVAKTPTAVKLVTDLSKALADLASQASKLKGIGSSVNSIGSAVSKLGSSSVAVSGATKQSGGLSAAFNKLKSSMNGISNSSILVGKRIKENRVSFIGLTGSVVALTVAFKALKNSFGSFIEKSMDYVEVLNYFDVAFSSVGETVAAGWREAGYDSAEEYVNSFAERAKQLTSKMTGMSINVNGTLTPTGQKSLGMDPEQLMNYQAGFAQMSNSIGVTSEMSLKLSNALTMLGADLASVKNISFESAWNNLQSGMAGMSRAVDKFGINIRNVNLEQKAAELGYEKSASAMNQNEKEMLRVIIMLESTKYAWGDMAETLNAPANQLRLLQQNFANLARMIGNIFLPVVAKVLPYINGLVIAMQRLFSWIGALLGLDFSDFGNIGGGSSGLSDLLDDAEAASSAVDDSADALEAANKAAKKLKRTILGFDEMNVLNDNDTSDTSSASSGTGSGGIGDYDIGILEDALSKAIEDYQKAWDEAFSHMENKANDFADEVEKAFWKVYDVSENTRIAILNLWNGGLKLLGNFTFGTLKDFWNNFLKPVGAWMLGDNSGLPRFFNITNRLLFNINWGKLKSSLADFYTSLQKLTKFSWTALMDFYQGFLKPIAVWTMSAAIPQLVDALTDFNNKVQWESLNSALRNFWKALAPFAINVGQGLVNFFKELLNIGDDFLNIVVPNGLNGLAEALKKISPEQAQGIGEALGKIGIALLAFKGIASVVSGIAAVGTAFSGLASGLGAIFGNEGVFATIGGSISALAGTIGRFGVKIVEVFAKVTAGAGSLSEVLGNVFLALEGVCWPVIGAVAAVSAALIDLWKTSETFRDTVSAAFTRVKEAVVGVFEQVQNAIVPLMQKFQELSSALYEFYEKSGLKSIVELVASLAVKLTGIIASKVIETFGNVFAGIAGTLSGIVDILTGIVEAILGIGDLNPSRVLEGVQKIATGIGETLGTVVGTVFDIGKNILSGLLEGILSVVTDIGKWIDDNIVNPFVNAFKSLFGIHSPSTVMAEMGGYLMEGLLGGIKSLVEDVVGVFTKIGERIGETWENIQTAASTAWEGITGTIGDAWDSLKTTASEKFGEIGSSVSDTWDNIKTTASEKWEDIKGTVGGTWENLTTTAAETFESISNTVSDTWETAKEKTGTAWENIKSTAGGIWDWLTGKSKDDFPEIQKNAEDSFNNTERTADSAWGNSSDSVVKSLRQMKIDTSTGMQQVFKNVESYMTSIYNTITNKFRWAGEMVNSQLGDMATDVGRELRNVASVAQQSVNQITNQFTSLGSRISGSLGNLYNVGRNAMQSFANGFKSVHIDTPHIQIDSYNRYRIGNSSFSTPNFGVRWYANGGFPNAGELFMARESGPELVGRMGSKNAVANNSQIVDGIKAGVYEAVRDAFASSGGGKGGDTNVTVTLEGDAKGMFKVIRTEGQKYQKSTGKPVFE